ncbi:cellulose synthase [Sinosporangium siamense]|uniref:Cellulose synthase n=1 Tax=Sinosporangium siamense TaxID=1367973 RepID=A0A919RHB7_9ACTN|nr:cellulose synthase [Sinosporangium siamense]GII93853.1 hypothetical protein Ssi02_40840 [Sinosporangium siamense]
MRARMEVHGRDEGRQIMDFNDIAWLPLCGGLTAVGLVLSFLAMRRKGLAAGLRGLAWSLLPLAAYLIGALQTLWSIGTSIAGFLAGLVFSPTVWVGVALTGLAVVLYVASGYMYGRGARSAGTSAAKGGGGSAPAAPSAQAGPAAPQAPAAPRRPQVAKSKPKADDDFSDIEELLKRRGIS